MTITPAADGWRLAGAVDGAPARLVRTIDEAAAAVPPGASVRLSLPVTAVLMERMRLPATDREELAGMAVLQLEKTLPYGVDEMTSGFDIIAQEGNESDLLAVAVSNDQLETLCAPLRRERKLPDEVAIFAIQLAAKFPRDEVLALVFREVESTILAVAQKGKLVAAHACPATEDFLAELPRMLLAAELEGAPVNFTKVAVERELAGSLGDLKEQFGSVRTELVSIDAPLDAGPVNLVPAGWTREQRKEAQKAKLRDWLALAGAVYLCFLLAAAGFIIWLQRQVAAVDRQVTAAAPAVDLIATRKARWTALEAATDPTRYSVEILQQINKSIPSPELHVTVFDQTPSQFMVEGEAPTADMASQYMEALRANPALKAFRFDSGPPALEGPEQRAHFRIFGKLL